MKTSDYLKRMAELGIGRGSFAKGFKDEATRDQKAPRAAFRNQRIGKREEPGRLPDEDLSALNDKRWRESASTGRKGGRIAARKLKGEGCKLKV